MCNPLAIGSMAASTVGSLISSSEANANARRMQNARNGATMEELARNKVYGEKSRGAFDNSLNIFNPTSQAAGLTQSQADVGSSIARNAPTNVGSITSTIAPKVVGDSETARLGDVFAKGASADQNLGNLKGYDRQWQNNKIGLNDNARTIDMYGDFARTSAGVNQLEQRAAYQNAYKPPSGIGDILQFAGNMGSYAGGRGFNPFGAPVMNPGGFEKALNGLAVGPH